MAKLPQIGLEAILKTDSFSAGMREYLNGVERLTSQTQAASGGLSGGLALALGAAGGAVSSVIGGILIPAFGRASEAAGGFFGVLQDGARSAIEAAGRFEEVALSAQVVGQRMGYSEQEIDGQIAAVRRLGIEAETSARLIAQLVRYELNLSQATDLARVAQDAAVISGENSSDTLDRLLHGIVTSGTLVLRHAGIMTDLTEAQDRYAASLGKTREELTSAEVVQANLNAVLEEGARLQGVYEAALTNPVKLWRSLDRVINDIWVSLGEPFQQSFYSVVRTIYELARGFSAAVSAGGALYPLLRTTGAAASVLTGALMDMFIVTEEIPPQFDEMGRQIQAARTAFRPQEWVQSFFEFAAQSAQVLGGFAIDVFGWGVEISAQLAAGMVQGAAQALVMAMDFIGGLLTFWLAPGSPPRVAPDVDQWGAAAMAEYLRGFTQADYSALNAIQAPLKKALELAVGGATDDETGRKLSSVLYEQLTGGLISALNAIREGGDYDRTILDRLAAATGEYGGEIRRLAELQLEQAKAQNLLNRANAEYEASVEAENQAVEKLIALQTEYNNMAASGAGRDVLSEKLAEIEAAEEGVRLAGQRKALAQAGAKQAEKEAKTLEEQLKLQTALVGELHEMGDATRSLADTLRSALGGGRETTLGGLTLPEPGAFGLSLDEEFETLKETVKEELAKLFAPLKDAWENDIRPAIDMVTARVEEFKAEIRPLVDWVDDEIVTPLRESFSRLVESDWFKYFGEASGGLLLLGAALALVAAGVLALVLVIAPLVLALASIPALIATVRVAWDENWLNIQETTATVRGWIVSGIDGIRLGLTNMQNTVAAVAAQIGAAFATIRDRIESIPAVLAQAKEQAALAMEEVRSKLAELKDAIESGFLTAIQLTTDWLENRFREALEGIGNAMESLGRAARRMGELLQGIRVPDWLVPGSPTPFEIGLRGIRREIERLNSLAIPDLSHRLAAQPAMTVQPGTGSAWQAAHALAPSRVITYNFEIGGQNALTEDAILRALRRRELIYGS